MTAQTFRCKWCKFWSYSLDELHTHTEDERKKDPTGNHRKRSSRN